MVLDRAFRYVAVSDAYCRAVMRARQDMIGQSLFDLFPNSGESGRRLKASFERVLATGQTDVISYIPYDIPKPESQGGGLEVRFWTASHSPVAGANGQTEYIIQNTTDVTELVRLGRVPDLPLGLLTGEGDLVTRAQEAEEEKQALLKQSQEFHRLFQQAPGFFAVLSGPDHVFTFANDAYLRLVGHRDLLGKPLREVLPEVVSQGFTEVLDRVYRTGQSAGGEGTRVMLQKEPDSPPEEFYLDFAYDAIRDAYGRVTGVFVQGMDTTQSTRTKRQQALLIDEINHRVKNTLASVQSIAAQTFRPDRDFKSAKAAFDARLTALTKTHNMLSQRQWSDTDLRDLVRQEFSGVDGQRIAISGPSVKLTAKTSIAVALMVHELATNAAKHGALSVQTGRVEVVWGIEQKDDSQRLMFRWREMGGPHLSPPGRKGFGIRLIETIVRGELGGEVSLNYDSHGLDSQFLLPIDVHSNRLELS